MLLTHLVELLNFMSAIKNGVPSVQLDKDAAKGPHVNGSAVREAKHDLWTPVKA